MKRILLTVLIAVLLTIPSISIAQQCVEAYSSGTFTSSQVVAGVSVKFVDMGAQTDGTADVTVLLYDNATAASGTIRAWMFIPSGSKVGGWNAPVPLVFSKGIYASVSGTGITRLAVSYCH
jgi:hypothetical protein